MYESEKLNKLWQHGIATVQDLTKETAGYAAKYIMKKRLGVDSKLAYEKIDENGEIHQIKPEYAAMSLKPGLGAEWYKKYGRDVYPHDFVIADGTKHRPPKYYDKLMKKDNLVDIDQVEFARYQRAKDSTAEQTDERRAVRETVRLARVQNHLKRELE